LPNVARPLVSVVVPSYQQGRFLEEALRSMLDQEYEPLEVIVVDGGSTDESVEVIRRHSDRLVWWVTEPDDGQADALNKGFGRARGEILGWLCSDDVLLPGAIARVVDALESDLDALLVYGEALFVDEDGGEIFPLEPRPFELEAMVRACANHVVQPGSLFRRRAWDAAGPFNVRGHYLFDFEFALSVARFGTVVAIPDRLALYRVHPESKSGGASLLKARDYVRFADEVLAGSDLPGAEEGRARAYLAAGDYFYDGGDLGRARRYLARSLRLRPTRRAAALLARALARAAKHRVWLLRRGMDAAVAHLPALAAKERVYDAEFFEHTDEAHRAAYRRLADALHEHLRPRSVVDVGCGTGGLIAALAARGVSVLGIEGSRHAIARSEVGDRIVRANLERGVPQLGEYDLCICIEVAEHLPPRRAASLVSGLAGLSDRVVFTAATPGQGGTHHVNEQPATYWEALFAEHGFARSAVTETLRGELRDVEQPKWLARNLVVFERNDGARRR
jgi:glycosyltransferase involved in cell wall biosynthesis